MKLIYLYFDASLQATPTETKGPTFHSLLLGTTCDFCERRGFGVGAGNSCRESISQTAIQDYEVSGSAIKYIGTELFSQICFDDSSSCEEQNDIANDKLECRKNIRARHDSACDTGHCLPPDPTKKLLGTNTLRDEYKLNPTGSTCGFLQLRATTQCDGQYWSATIQQRAVNPVAAPQAELPTDQPRKYHVTLDGLTEDLKNICFGLFQKDAAEDFERQSVAGSPKCILKAELENFNKLDGSGSALLCDISTDTGVDESGGLQPDNRVVRCKGTTCEIVYTDGVSSFIDNEKFKGIFNIVFAVFTPDTIDTDYLCPRVIVEGMDLIRRPMYHYIAGTTTMYNNQVVFAVSVVGNTLRFEMEPFNIFDVGFDAITGNEEKRHGFVSADEKYKILFHIEEDKTCEEFKEFSVDKNCFEKEDDIPEYGAKNYLIEMEYQYIMHCFAGEDNLYVALCPTEKSDDPPKIVKDLTKFLEAFNKQREVTTNQKILSGIGIFLLIAAQILMIYGAILCCFCNNQR